MNELEQLRKELRAAVADRDRAEAYCARMDAMAARYQWQRDAYREGLARIAYNENCWSASALMLLAKEALQTECPIAVYDWFNQLGGKRGINGIAEAAREFVDAFKTGSYSDWSEALERLEDAISARPAGGAPNADSGSPPPISCPGCGDRFWSMATENDDECLNCGHIVYGVRDFRE